jgi:ribosomal-protein-alanine N-acetyltransferase
MTATLRLEPMAGRHIDAVQAIDKVAYPNPWSAVTWRNELAASDRVHMVAINGDTLVGHAGMLFVLDEAHITTVAVDSSREGQGIATRLLVILLEQAHWHGSAAATLEVRASEKRPQRLYSRLGFKPAGVRSGYYKDPVEDAIVMWLHALDGPPALRRMEQVAAELPRAHAEGQS